MRFTFPRFIPANATITERAVGVVYSYQVDGKLAAVAYAGKSNKKAFHHLFRSQERLDIKIAEFFAGLEAHKQRVVARRSEAKTPHNLKVGDVVYNSWGYDQTNVDFYQVARVSSNFVWLQETGGEMTLEGGCGPMSGHVQPAPGTASGELTKHSVRMYDDRASVCFKHGAGSKYDGQAKYCSWYA
jgi:hypothetical protein